MVPRAPAELVPSCTRVAWTGECAPTRLARGDFVLAFADDEGVLVTGRWDTTYWPWTGARAIGASATMRGRVETGARLDSDRVLVGGYALAMVDSRARYTYGLDSDDGVYKPWEAEVVGLLDDRIFYLRRYCCSSCGRLMSMNALVPDKPREEAACVNAVRHRDTIVTLEGDQSMIRTVRIRARDALIAEDVIQLPRCDPADRWVDFVDVVSDDQDVFVRTRSWKGTYSCLQRYTHHALQPFSSVRGDDEGAHVAYGLYARIEDGAIVLVDTSSGTELARHPRPNVGQVRITRDRILWIEDEAVWMVPR